MNWSFPAAVEATYAPATKCAHGFRSVASFELGAGTATPNSRDVGRLSTVEVVRTLDASRGPSDDLEPKALIGVVEDLVGATRREYFFSP